jgi:hypothetical protein
LSASLSENINPSPRDSDVIRLQELGICAGRLDDLIEPDQEDVALAMIGDMTVEVPIAHAPVMRPMVGKKIWLALVKGQIRAGFQT